MVIHKINPSVDYNYRLKYLDTQPIEPANQNSSKVPKDVEENIIIKLWGLVQCPLPT